MPGNVTLNRAPVLLSLFGIVAAGLSACGDRESFDGPHALEPSAMGSAVVAYSTTTPWP